MVAVTAAKARLEKVTFEGTRNVLEACVAGGVDGVKPLHAGDRKGDIKHSYADVQGSEGCSGV